MKNIFKNKKLILCISLVVVFAIVVSVASSMTAFAGNVTILEDINPDLIYKQIKGEYESWDTTQTSYYEHESGSSKYKMVTNAYNVWWTTDDVDFAYKEYNFNFGSKAELTIETTITELGPQEFMNAACGIMIRSSLKNDASCVNMQIRPGDYIAVYRTSDGTGAAAGPRGEITPKMPIKLKMVLKNGKVTCYWANAGGTYAKLAPSLNLIHGDTVYVGLEAYSGVQANIDTVVFDGLNIKIDAPEGTKYDEPSVGGDDVEEEEKVVLPDDNIVSDEVLLKETFSDGDIQPVEDEKKATYNANWKTNCTDLNETIVLNEEKDNYYLKKDFDTNYYVADKVMKKDPRDWSDYSFEADVRINSAHLESEAKNLTFMTRFMDTAQYGYRYYAIYFNPIKETEDEFFGRLSIGRVLGKANIGHEPTNLEDSEGKVLCGHDDSECDCVVNYELDYFNKENADRWVKIKIECFDNTITVYWDGKQVLKYTDNTKYCIGRGTVGVYSNGIGADVDNIVVRKMEDYYGESYDNKICSNWDEPVPDIVKHYVEKGWYTYKEWEES
ncbi:MAG: hypothetical protein IJP22_01915 [Clostridia bacterium]|nr:hypothetical protein [Clostridia bacterium]